MKDGWKLHDVGPTICSDHLGRNSEVMSVCHVSEGRRGNECHLYIGVTLHNLLYPCQREWRVSIVGSLLLCSIDLSLPEGVEELVEGLS